MDDNQIHACVEGEDTMDDDWQPVTASGTAATTLIGRTTCALSAMDGSRAQGVAVFMYKLKDPAAVHLTFDVDGDRVYWAVSLALLEKAVMDDSTIHGHKHGDFRVHRVGDTITLMFSSDEGKGAAAVDAAFVDRFVGTVNKWCGDAEAQAKVYADQVDAEWAEICEGYGTDGGES